MLSDVRRSDIASWILGCIFVALAGGFVASQWNRLFPCSFTIAYSIGAIDPRFSISREEFAAQVEAAANMWETSVKKPLFREVPSGGMVVSAVYDYRQEAQEKMKELGIKADEGRQSLEQSRQKYESLRQEVDMKQSAYQALVAAYDTKKEEYDALLRAAEARGGMTSDEIARAESMRQSLNASATTINTRREELNQIIAQLNALVTVLNALGLETNSTIQDYNAVGDVLHDQFDAGLFTRDFLHTKIEIFAFNDQEELKRLLMHELGHALGVEHVADSGAVMYYLNLRDNPTLTPADIDALKGQCNIR